LTYAHLDPDELVRALAQELSEEELEQRRKGGKRAYREQTLFG
jgi:hypothetical protein